MRESIRDESEKIKERVKYYLDCMLHRRCARVFATTVAESTATMEAVNNAMIVWDMPQTL